MGVRSTLTGRRQSLLALRVIVGNFAASSGGEDKKPNLGSLCACENPAMAKARVIVAIDEVFIVGSSLVRNCS